MTTVNREAEPEVIPVNRTDTDIVLIVGLTVIAFHDTLHISRTTIVGHGYGYHRLIHSLKPCTPVELTTTWQTSTIAVTPTIVVGTDDSIFTVVLTGQHNHKVVPVVGAIGEVLDAGSNGLTNRHIVHIRMSTPPTGRVIFCTKYAIELQVAVVNSKAEVEVFRINRVDAIVLLRIDLTVCALHHGLHISGTITVVSNGYSNLGTVHSSKPCTPVTLGSNRRTSTITITPAIIIGTDYGILCIISTTENHDEVVPVVGTTSVVGEAAHKGLIRAYLDILRMSTPPTSRIVGSTKARVHLINNLELCSSDDRCIGSLTFVGLGIGSHEGLLAQ